MSVLTQNNTEQPIRFKASWTDQNKHLEKGLFDKVSQFVFGFLIKVIRAATIPSSRTNKEDIEQMNAEFRNRFSSIRTGTQRLLNEQFRPVPFEVTTPDGITIKGTHFKNNSAREDSPTVIFFQPNATHSKEGVFDWVLEQAALQEVPYNFVSFDYRGSDGTDNKPASVKDLYLDGDSIYQFVTQHLKVNHEHVHFHGFSLGGGISAQLKAIHPECTGNYVNERSFTSTNAVIANCVNWILSGIASTLTSLLNWNIDATKAMETLKGKTLIVHHPKDELMQKQASLYNHIFKTGTHPTHFSHLDLSQSNQESHFYHADDLTRFNTETFRPKEEIAQFLFSSPLSAEKRMIEIFRSASMEFKNKVYHLVANRYQNGGSYLGSGEDACYNRNGQTISDRQLADAIIAAKKEE